MLITTITLLTAEQIAQVKKANIKTSEIYSLPIQMVLIK